jgi:hypothetical protein
MTFDEATGRLVALARQNNGTITASQVEADPELSREKSLVCAAARALASATNVFADDDGDSARDWFPYASIAFTELRAARSLEHA